MRFEDINWHELKLQTMEWKGHWAVSPYDVYNYYKQINPNQKVDIGKFFKGFVEYNKNAEADIEIYKQNMKQKKEEQIAKEKEQKKLERQLRKAEQERLKLLKHPEREPMPENTRPVVRAFVERFLMGDNDEE